MSDEPQPQEAPVELDPRAQAVQHLALAEQRVAYARRERDRAVKRVEEVEAELAEARSAVSEALGVRETDLVGLR